MAENALGIDFGTSFCTMCARNAETGKPETISDACGMDKIPSVVYWGPDGDIRVGQTAMDLLADSDHMEPERRAETFGRIIRSVKRVFFHDRALALPGGETVYPVDVAAAILKYLKSNAEERCFHGPARSATLTHPASFTRAQKTLLEEAGKKAGFVTVRLLEEPVAAAMGYASSSGQALGKGVLVYDLGGGTLDLAFVARDGDGFRVPVAPCGDAACGGDDFDRALYDFAEADLLKTQGRRFSEEGGPLNLPFWFACRDVKERLSRSDSGTLRHYFDDGSRYALSVGRSEFNRLIGGRVAASVALARQLLQRVAAENHAVDTAILIGGASRIPLVRELLEAALPVKPLATMRDDSAVAMGAALVGVVSAPIPRPSPCPTQSERKAGDVQTVDLGGGVMLELVWCQPGTFWMGSPEYEDDRDYTETRHRVTLTKGFWMGKYPVTQGQWKALMREQPGSFTACELLGVSKSFARFVKTGDFPIEFVSWKDCQSFIKRLNLLVDGGGFRLPTEAEWEFACRAGTKDAYAVTGDLDEIGWYDENSGGKTHPVGELKPNGWGLYDMHGNVWEWCQDWYGYYPSRHVTDPLGAASGSSRVCRGGSWNDHASFSRSAQRFDHDPSDCDNEVGFRLARNLP